MVFGGLGLTFQLPCSLPVPTPTFGCQSAEAVAITHFLPSELEMCCRRGPYCPSGLLVCECLSGPTLVAGKDTGHTAPSPGLGLMEQTINDHCHSTRHRAISQAFLSGGHRAGHAARVPSFNPGDYPVASVRVSSPNK